jgi:integrase
VHLIGRDVMPFAQRTVRGAFRLMVATLIIRRVCPHPPVRRWRCVMSVSARRLTDGPGGELRFHYLVRWRDVHRIEHARMFATESEAAEFDADVKAGRLEPGSRPRQHRSPTFQAEAMDWLATKQATKRVRTAARYESHLRLHVLPAFGPIPVVAITRHDVQQWVNTLTQGSLAASTIGDIYRGVFKAVLNKAVLDGRLAVSPCCRIELPQVAAEEVVPPTPEQVLAVIGALPLRYRAMAAIAAGAGARISEAAGVTVSHLRGDPVRLRIDRQLLPARRDTSAGAGGCRYAGADRCCRALWGPPKSAAGIRDQPVPALIASAVEAHLRVCAPAPCGLLFTTAAGAALSVANFRNRVWKPTVRTIDGVPDQLRFHDLRHAFATQLSAGGVPFKEITALLGQSSPGETERYVHRLPDQTLAQRARTAIDHAFPAVGPTLAEHGTDQVGPASRSGIADFAD